MYDEYSRQLISLLPELPQIDRAACRRALSSAYFHVVQTRLAVPSEDSNDPNQDANRDLLRRMVDALESVAVFDPLHGQQIPIDVQNASAFVAAEALALLSALAARAHDSDTDDPLLEESVYSAIEAALLYMIGGYDANAMTLAQHIDISSYSQEPPNHFRSSRLRESMKLVERIRSFLRGEIRRSEADSDLPSSGETDGIPAYYQEILDDVRSRLYARIGDALREYFDWLGGYTEVGRDNATTMLQSVRDTTMASKHSGYTALADVYHLSSLLLAAIDRTGRRSVVHSVPPPLHGSDATYMDEYQEYLKYRACGSEEKAGRPFLWPTTLEYIAGCLPGPQKSAVVSMPTGSGKSFVAELAVVHALEHGWVLYLAPTNALVHQIHRDLKDALEPFSGITVRSFVGDDEYTTLTGEQIQPSERRFVAVMTPEKCALATRLYPDQFADCSLCVFDECHLLNDQHRGLTADILLAQLSLISPRAQFLLMSAMVGNASELSDWLQSIKGESASISIKWRPTRSMRGMLAVDSDPLRTRFDAATSVLSQLPPRRVNQEFRTPLGLVVGLSGAWTVDGSYDYRACRMPISFPGQASRRNQDPEFPSWKNTGARLLSEELARHGMPTICFLLSSRHHAFSSANQADSTISTVIGYDGSFPDLVEAWLSISDAELGVQSALRELLAKGVAVHTSAMLQTEQAASEWMFGHRHVQLMFATGTLAQGLNLPAVAVVVAGTTMGDPRDRDVDTVAGVSRADAMILNGFGRAGRPGFSNQGIGVLVSDEPYLARVTGQLDPSPVLRSYDVLGKPDAVVEIRSPVESFLDKLMTLPNATLIEPVGDETILVSLLGEHVEDVSHAGHILSNTLAAYHVRHRFDVHTPTLLNSRILEVKRALQEQTGAPEWMNQAAMRAGVDYHRAWLMYSSFLESDVRSADQFASFGVIDWLQSFFDTMSHMPPREISLYLPDESIKRVNVLTRMRDAVSRQINVDSVPWQRPANWHDLWQNLMGIVKLFMGGAPYADIAHAYLEIPVTKITNRRTKGDHPIPAVFKFLSDVINRLAIDAGCFLAIVEQAVYDPNAASVPEALQALPLCIRNGCDSLGTLTWYRFGYRQRSCAHAFQRAFPVPDTMTDDSSRIAWVQQTRGRWLAGDLDATGEPLVRYARTVITAA